MTELKDVRQQMLNLIEAYNNADKSLPDLARKAQTFADQAERRQDIQDQIDQLEGNIGPFEAELIDLKQPYLDALWEQDVPEQRRLQKEKKRLEAEITAIRKAVGDLRKKLDADAVDAHALFDLKAALDGFNVPNAWDFAESLKLALQAVERDLKSRAGSIDNLVAGIQYDEDRYEAYRLEHDERYRSRKESREEADRIYARQQRQQAERLKRIQAKNEREELIAAGAFDQRVSERDAKPWEEED